MRNYIVTIDRQHNRSRLDAKYWVEVKSGGDDITYGLFYRIKSAKKSAIKAILKNEKDLNDGVQFGLIFSESGTADKVINRLGG
jgi:hypothetical protein